ncbi:uncharacterized protein V1513DRAFT_480203 [Lipomyces chichibuensis]|uniref:uncharacterized protein n=1 Tax=Lipomyces chichibuensis TaxID=1546026 RepID=UPI00334422AC
MSVISRKFSIKFVASVIAVVITVLLFVSITNRSILSYPPSSIVDYLIFRYTLFPFTWARLHFFLDKLGRGLYSVTPPDIAPHYKDVANVTTTPVKSPGSRRRNDANKVVENKDCTPTTSKHMKSKKQPKQQAPQSQLQQSANAPATPIRQSSDPNRYAGPTFHSSPAPNNLPVPKFASTSAPTGVSVEQYFAGKKSVGSDASISANTIGSAPASLASTTSSPASSPGASHTMVRAEVIDKVEDTTTSTAKVEISGTSRFGDSVVFKPRRKGLAPVTTNSERFSHSPSSGGGSSSVTDLSSPSAQQRRAPAEFDFLFKSSSSESIPSSRRRAPRDFDFLFKQALSSISK